MQPKKRIRIGFSFLIGSGGPVSFMKNLRASIAKQRLAKVSSFLNPFNDINIFSNYVRNIYGTPYIFRVDGIAFDINDNLEIRSKKNAPIFSGIRDALGVVFQSQFGLQLISKFYGNIERSYIVINNGVDLGKFSPDGINMRKMLAINDEDLVFITSAKWRVHKRLQDVVDVVIEYEKKSNLKCHLIILGKNAIFDDRGHKRIYKIGYVDPKNLPVWYRTADIFLFLSWLDHCPNTVIEAIACNLPVICSNQGGTKELIELTNGGIVAQADEDYNFGLVPLYHPPKPDYGKILAAIDNVVNNLECFRKKINKENIDINNIAKKYVAFAESLLHL